MRKANQKRVAAEWPQKIDAKSEKKFQEPSSIAKQIRVNEPRNDCWYFYLVLGRQISEKH